MEEAFDLCALISRLTFFARLLYMKLYIFQLVISNLIYLFLASEGGGGGGGEGKQMDFDWNCLLGKFQTSHLVFASHSGRCKTRCSRFIGLCGSNTSVHEISG